MKKVFALFVGLAALVSEAGAWPLPPADGLQGAPVFGSTPLFNSPSPTAVPAATGGGAPPPEKCAPPRDRSSETSAGAGLVSAYSDGDIFLSLPLSVTFWDTLKFEAIPSLVHREPSRGGFAGGVNGLGDTYAGMKLKYKIAREALGISGLTFKFPTGDPQAMDKERRERLALGTGSYDAILSQAAVFFEDDFTFYLAFAFRYNGPYEYSKAGLEASEQYAPVFFYFVQADYNLHKKKWYVYLSLGGHYAGEGRIESEERVAGMHDRLLLLENGLGVKYYPRDDLGLQLGATYPTLVIEDDDSLTKYPRQVSPYFCIQSWF